MSERIRELAKQATKQYSPTYYTQEWIQGFAKSIIEECAGIYCSIDNGNLHMGTNDYLRALHKHFGVEDQVENSNQEHTCPYKEEIHGDHKTLCNCDPEQTRQCAMDI